MAESGRLSQPGRRQGRMRRIVVSLLKGGVAKSETAVHLAHGMALAGYKVLLVDTDVQSHCSEMLGINPTQGLAHVITGWVDPFDALSEGRENLWVLAGGNDLAAVKMEIARRELAPEAVLSDTLARYEHSFDAMIVDTAPGWDTLLVNALYCCEEVLSPVSMEPMALSGLVRFEDRLGVIQRYKPELSLRWVVPTFVDGRVRKSAEILKQLIERYGERIAPPIKYSVKLSEATAFGRTIYEHDPNGIGAQAYHKLTERIIRDDPTKAERHISFAPPPEARPAAEQEQALEDASPALAPLPGHPQQAPAPLPAQAAPAQEGPAFRPPLAARVKQPAPKPPEAEQPAAAQQAAEERISAVAVASLRERLRQRAVARREQVRQSSWQGQENQEGPPEDTPEDHDVPISLTGRNYKSNLRERLKQGEEGDASEGSLVFEAGSRRINVRFSGDGAA